MIGMSDLPTPYLANTEPFVVRLAPTVFALADHLRARMAEAAAAAGLPPPLAIALRHLDPERPMPMRVLAGRMGCHPSYVTGLVDRLEAQGLVERRPAAHDRRLKQLAVTAAGAARRDCLLNNLGQITLGVETVSPMERATLLRLLERLLGTDVPPLTCQPDEAQGGTTGAPPTAAQSMEGRGRGTDRVAVAGGGGPGAAADRGCRHPMVVGTGPLPAKAAAAPPNDPGDADER